MRHTSQLTSSHSPPQATLRVHGQRALMGMIVLGAQVCLSAPARATPAVKDSEPSAVLGEPAAGFEAMHITHEALRVDARGIDMKGQSQPVVRVTARYTIDHRGDVPQALSLQFVATSLVEGQSAQVTLDDALVAATLVEPGELPPSWQPPERAPKLPGDASDAPLHQEEEADFAWIDAAEAARYKQAYLMRARGQDLRFEVTLTPGEHTLSVSYSAKLGVDELVGAPAPRYQLGYVLAPARQWASFGELTLTVLAPQGWEVASSLPITRRDGGRWEGAFEGVPADSLALTLGQRVPSTTLALVQALPFLMLLMTVLVGLTAGHTIGAASRARGVGRGKRVAAMVALSLGVGLVCGATLLLGVRASHEWLGLTRLSDGWELVRMLSAMLFSVIAALTGVTTTLGAGMIVPALLRDKQPKRDQP